ncbi:MAG: energy-coupling factor transporter ATPase [Veillonellales bacterium]
MNNSNSIIEIENASFTYSSRSLPSVTAVNLTIEPGEFVLLTGATGCGKSTLLKMLNGLIPQESGGLFSGRVTVGGRDVSDFSVAEMSSFVGMMFQSPDDQIFSTTVGDEVAFILENGGMNLQDIPVRVSGTLALVGLAGMENRSVHALSGGQKQRLALAAVLAARPRVLALDEPISQLDPRGATALLEVVEKLNKTLGITVVIVEHRLHEVMPLCHRVVVMDQGKIVWQGTRQESFRQPEIFSDYGLRLPQTVNICQRLGISTETAAIAPVVEKIRERYDIVSPNGGSPACRAAAALTGGETETAALQDIVFRYGKAERNVLDHLSLSVFKGQFIALMGNNGAGKSTLLQHIAGLLQPLSGRVRVMGKPAGEARQTIGMVMQNPDFMLFNATVREEVEFALRQRCRPAEAGAPCRTLIQALGLAGMEEDFPLALSRGQRLRVAIAAVLSYRPAVLLLDEPTTGQDIGHIDDIVLLLKRYTAAGGSAVFCTHDAEVAAKYADRVVVMTRGRIVADSSPTAVFSRDDILRPAGLKPPAAMLVARQLYNGTAVTVEEVVSYVRQNSVGSSAG